MFEPKQKIALALLSGGLDSRLASKLIADLGRFLVVGYHFHHPFSGAPAQERIRAVKKAARDIGIPLIIDSDYDAFIEMTKTPAHGRGKGANPCRDCRIFVLRRAKRILSSMNGHFLISGEVLGQRPMSQVKNSLNLIEKQAEVRGVLLRPLSGKLLPPTLPETEGWIARDELLDFVGRNRKRQFALAEKLGIKDYPTPAGGCLLTEKAYSARYYDLLKDAPDFGEIDMESLKFGRHFRLESGIKLIVARDEAECNLILERLSGTFWIATTVDIPGPFAALDREPTEQEIMLVGGIVAGYSKAREFAEITIELTSPDGAKIRKTVIPQDKRDFVKFML